MKDKRMERWSTYEPFYVEIANQKIADIIITNHAQARWTDRISQEKSSMNDICSFMWEKLKTGKVKLYYKNDRDVYVIDDDLVLIAQCAVLKHTTDLVGNPLYQMIIITFLGRMSQAIELRDIKSYYAWLRHNRRVTLIKSNRKKR